MQTAYGNFDLDTAGNAARVPYNLGTGPALFSMNLCVSKTIEIGPKVEGGWASHSEFSVAQEAYWSWRWWSRTKKAQRQRRSSTAS